MTKAKEATMRRIAIVLASLPDPIAQKLLGSLQSDSQRSVRAALSALDDVDPLERRRALDGFASSLRPEQGPITKSSDAAEIVFSRTAIRSLNERADNPPPAAPIMRDAASPLAFLWDVDEESLVMHLSREMPQTLAIVLASISPAQAARVLPRLDVNLRTEAMRRIANLREVPNELIEEIGNQLRSRLVNSTNINSTQKTAAGKRALDAILAQMPVPEQQVSVAKHTPPPRAVAVAAPVVAAPEEKLPKSSSSPALKIADGTQKEQVSESVVRSGARGSDPFNSTDSVHDYLIGLSVDRLRESLGRVEVRSALLTLCGLPNATAEAVLNSLPRKQAKQVRDQLCDLGPLQLREIDSAKEAVAKVAFDYKPITRHAITAVAA